MNTFTESLQIWKTSEMVVLEYLRIRNPSAMMIEGKCKEADIIVFWEPNTLFEVKQDYKSAHTGNFVVEISFWWNDSGIITTRSDVWVFVDQKCMRFIKPIQILRCIAKYKTSLQLTSWTWPGDYKSKQAYLIPAHLLDEFVMFTVPTESENNRT